MNLSNQHPRSSNGSAFLLKERERVREGEREKERGSERERERGGEE
jgi:hypothetical protein